MYEIPKMLKFGELSYNEGNLRVRITDVKWGKYKDIDGETVDFQRGNGALLKISNSLCLCSSHSPAFDQSARILYVWGSDESKDSESARANSSSLALYEMFRDIQKLSIESLDTELEQEKEPVVSDEDLQIEESRNPNF